MYGTSPVHPLSNEGDDGTHLASYGTHSAMAAASQGINAKLRPRSSTDRMNEGDDVATRLASYNKNENVIILVENTPIYIRFFLELACQLNT